VLVGLLTRQEDAEDVKLGLWTKSLSWSPTLVSLLPLWLVSFAVMAEGFPRPPISIELATFSLALAIFLGILLLWKGWLTVELLLYSFLPFLLLPGFDEISTTYKTPFIMLCALILTVGMIGYQLSHWARPARLLILLFAAVVTLAMAGHATSSFWAMVSDLGYVRCFPDAHGCAPLTGEETPWWVLFLSP
jgi:hypothetical protein